MRKVRIGYTALFAAFAITAAGLAGLTGCTGESAISSGTETAGSRETAENPSPDETGAEAFITRGSSATMVETNGDLFFKYKESLWKIDKKTDEQELLKAFGEGERNSAFWVYDNSIYFDETNYSDYAGPEDSRICRLDLGTGKEEQLSDLPGVPSAIYASERVLYVKGYQFLKMFKLDDEGGVQEELDMEDTLYAQIPEGCTEDSTELLARTVGQYGYMALSNQENLVIADKDGKNPRSIAEVKNGQSRLFTEEAVYVLETVGEAPDLIFRCIRYDINTLEPTVMFQTDSYITLLQVRDGYLYYMEDVTSGLGGQDRVFWQVDIKTQQKRQMTSQPGVAGAINFYSYFGGFYVTADAFYTERILDYEVLIERSSLVNQEDTILLKTPVYHSKIGELGIVEGEKRKDLCGCGEKTMQEIYVEKLVLNKGNQEADTAVNQVLQKHFDDTMSDLMPPNPGDESIYHDEYFSAYTLVSQVSDITYMNDRYFCLMMSSYEYSGGAHGMPYKDVFVFDRETGKQLFLKDIVEISEADLKSLVSRSFRAFSEETGFSFSDPQTLEQEVSKSVTMDSPFYLTEEGIAFYYMPYEIAAYAAGFPEVVIPYSEFEMKIDLK